MVTVVATGGPTEVFMVGVMEMGQGACGTQGRIKGHSGVVRGDGRKKASYSS